MFASHNVVLHVSRGSMKLSKRLMALLLGCSALGIAVRTPSQDLGAGRTSVAALSTPREAASKSKNLRVLPQDSSAGDIKILMDMRKFAGKFEKIQAALGLSDKGKTILFSVKKELREVYIEIGGQRMKVVRNELSTEEYFAYTTKGGERVNVREYAERCGSMEKGIMALVAERESEK